MIDLINVVRSELTTWGVAPEWAHLLVRLLAIALVALIAFIAHALARGPVLKAIFAIIRRTDTSWDDALVEARTYRTRPSGSGYGNIPYRTHAPRRQCAPDIYSPYGRNDLSALVGALVIDALLSVLLSIYRRTDTSREISIKSLVSLSRSSSTL